MVGQDALFDVPESPRHEVAIRPGASCTRSLVAEVSVDDSAALREAALASFDQSTFIDLSPLPDSEEDEAVDTRDDIRDNDSAALSWLLEPTESVMPLLEAEAVRLHSAEICVEETAPGRLKATSTVTVIVEDLAAFREVALARCPPDDHQARRAIGRNMATAWQWAAGTNNQLRAVPGISVTTQDTELRWR